ncbi:MAG: methionine aminopeptidase type [Jatrophihabitantaceae bacterium]|nr:methionine aminopeptidase type [Jatrophihabitantaceae bacterium]
MRAAGLVVAEALEQMRVAVAPGVSTLELDAVARDVLAAHGATSNFLGYDIGAGPFPAVICASVNDRIVHGIPRADEVLRDGDLISLDFGAVVEGWHGDAAITVAVGTVTAEVAQLSAACEKALWDGIAAIGIGRRLGDVSRAVQDSVEGSGSYGILAGYGGHGIGTEMHQDPHVLNYGTAGRGVKLQKGLCLAIEPMITLGTDDSYELDDGWTIVTADNSWSSHWEHSVALVADGLWVLTAADGGRAELAARGVAVSSLAD